MLYTPHMLLVDLKCISISSNLAVNCEIQSQNFFDLTNCDKIVLKFPNLHYDISFNF